MMELKRFAEVLLLDCDELREPALFAAAYERMDAARRAKTDAWKTEEDRRLSLGVGLLAQVLLREAGIAPERLAFEENGKPFIVGGEMFISLSHAGDWAMTGLSDAPIAVDVETLRPDEWGIAGHFYTPEEKRYVTGADDPDAAFWRLWCRKECLVKRDGLRDPRELPVLGGPPDGRFWEYPLLGHICVCLTVPGIEPEFRVCGIEDLLD